MDYNCDFPTLSTDNRKMYTGGTFDVPHVGHYNFLRKCKELFPNLRLIVSLNTDTFIEKYKGKPPLFTYQEREHFLRLCPYVDGIVENTGGSDSKPAILSVRPSIVIIGNDWLEKDYCQQMHFDSAWLTEQNISVVFIPYTQGISSSEIKRRLNA